MTIEPDVINGLFQLIGSLATWLNVVYLYKHKQANGVHVSTFIFFATWGVWNLYYYSHLDQVFSYWTGFSQILANLAWIVLYIRYRKNERKFNASDG